MQIHKSVPKIGPKIGPLNLSFFLLMVLSSRGVALILLVPLIVFGVLVRFGGTGLSPQAGQPSP